MRGGYNPERAAMILADAIALGDKLAAKKWGIHRATIDNYRKRLQTEPKLRHLLEENQRHAEKDLATIRVQFLREAIEVLRTKMKEDDATIFAIAGAVKIVGELHQTSTVLDDDRLDSPHPDAPETEGGEACEAAGTH